MSVADFITRWSGPDQAEQYRHREAAVLALQANLDQKEAQLSEFERVLPEDQVNAMLAGIHKQVDGYWHGREGLVIAAISVLYLQIRPSVSSLDELLQILSADPHKPLHDYTDADLMAICEKAEAWSLDHRVQV